jgi:hypothetical protein
MLGVKRAVWLAKQAIYNNAGHPKLIIQMCMLFLDEPLAYEKYSKHIHHQKLNQSINQSINQLIFQRVVGQVAVRG